MLSIGRLGPSGAAYYTEAVARGSEDYYLGAGEAPGMWVGAGVDALGLSGVVDDTDFVAVLAGQHPAGGTRLVAVGEGRLPGLDLTFSAPKSVSLLWATTTSDTNRQLVLDAHRAAVADAIAYLEGDAVWARRGRNGVERVAVSGLVAAAFGHRTSRSGDPQLHTHVVAANIVRDAHGRWSAVDSRAVFRHARTAGFVYQARLRHGLTETLGVSWGVVRNGQADIAGIDRGTVEAFSARRADIVASLDERGLSTPNAARVATLATRPGKTAEDGVGLYDRWRTQAESAALDVDGLVGPGRKAVLGAEREDRLLQELAGAGGLTAQQSTFDRRDVIRALASAHPDGATLEDLDRLAGELLTGRGVVEVRKADDPGTGHRQAWTTVDLLAVEGAVLSIAARRSDAWVGVATTEAVDAALGRRPQLSGEQAGLVGMVTTTPAGVVTVNGKPGAGKTFALDAARDAWEASGARVIGAALAARAAAELEAGAGIPSTTLARLLGDLERPEGRLAPGSVIVVDEAGMVGTRTLHRLLDVAERQEVKVVLVGDRAQLPEIDAGGAFARLSQVTPTWQLIDNRRQSEPWERHALDLLREGLPRPALARYGEHGRITLADTAGQVRDQMIADWHQAHAAGGRAVMLAVRRADVADLNIRAQAARVTAGELDPTAALEAGGVRLLVGDEIVCARNDRRAGLRNGDRATITHLDTATGTLTGRRPDGAGVIIPGEYLNSGHVQLGYATTVHKAQGATVDHAFLLGDDRLYAEAGYVGLSRATHTNRLYVVAQPPPPLAGGGQRTGSLIDHVTAALGVSGAKTLSTTGTTPDDHLVAVPLDRLVGERDELLGRLLGSMTADPAGALQNLAEHHHRLQRTPADAPWAQDVADEHRRASLHAAAQVAARDRWAAANRRDGQHLAALTAAIDARTARLATAAVIDPPDHLLALLGPPPDTPSGRRDWTRQVGAVEAWREVSGRGTDVERLLEPPGALDPTRQWWHTATRALHPDITRHLGRDNEKGLSR